VPHVSVTMRGAASIGVGDVPGQSHLNRASAGLIGCRLSVRNRAAKKSSKQALNTDFTEKKIKPRIDTENIKLYRVGTQDVAHVTRPFSVQIRGLTCSSVQSVLKCLLCCTVPQSSGRPVVFRGDAIAQMRLPWGLSPGMVRLARRVWRCAACISLSALGLRVAQAARRGAKLRPPSGGRAAHALTDRHATQMQRGDRGLRYSAASWRCTAATPASSNA